MAVTRGLLVAVFGVVLLAAPPARAQQPATAENAALAEKLFQDARALMHERRFAEACAKLAESQRIDPGTGTLLNLGECFEKNGQPASAWATYREAEAAATRANEPARIRLASEKANALAKDLSYVVIEVDGAAWGKDGPPKNLVVTYDGKSVGTAGLGAPLPVDPGAHKVEAKAPGYKPWSRSVDVSLRATVKVPVARLERDPDYRPGLVDREKDASFGRAQRFLALGLGVVGLGAIGAGSWFGVDAIKTYDDADTNHCTKVRCTSVGSQLIDDSDDAATLSTFFLIGGAVALATAVVLYTTAPRGTASIKTAVLPGGGFRF
jgi:hypothetical protein